MQGVDLRIEHGEHVLLLGASGAGKSTLLAGVAGVLGGADEGDEAGHLLVGGVHPTRARGRVGLLQQDPDANIVLGRVGDDVAFGPENLGVPRELIWPRVRASLDAVGLGDLPLDHPTHALSGGQKQRLGIAGALALASGEADGTGVLLLDEPTANLDPDGVREVRDAVVRAARERDLTLVVVEHRVEVWSEVIDRVVVLGDEGVLADGSPAAVFAGQREALLAAGVWVPGSDTGITALPAASGMPALWGVDLAIGHDADDPVHTHLDVALPAGVSTVITGANGAGKSTLALTMAGLLPRLAGDVVAAPELRPPARPGRRWPLRQRSTGRGDRGAVRPDDPASWRSTDLLTRIGTVFQEPEHQFVASSVHDELAIGLRALRWDPARIEARVRDLLEALRLDALARANPFTLSGGEKRRLSVATVLATSPAVVFLDEPTFGQDRTTWLALVELVRGLLDEGRTVVSVTHDQPFVEALGQHRIHLPGRQQAGWGVPR